MNRLEKKLKESKPELFGSLQETKKEVKLLLDQYLKNFPEYTDHSIHHTEEVFNIVDEVLNDDEITNLNGDEIYVLSMSSYLHDIGMCIPEDKIKEIADTEELIKQRELHPDIKRESYLRDIHHILSAKFIIEEWELLKIPSKKYADAIALVSEGHRVVDIGNPEVYDPKFFVNNGREFVCLPYLSAVLRIADELDITNIRTPKLLTKYYMPENEKSIEEWQKHIANTQRNFAENYVIFEVECSNHQMLASLEDQFNKIKSVLNYCQKVIRNISNTEGRIFSLRLDQVKEKYKYIGFDPKGIKYTFDVEKVVDAFVGENLYNDKLTSLREVIQNAVDTCKYKTVLEGENYTPEISIIIEDDKIIVKDNGVGMDEFIIKNFFGKLGSSFYQQASVKKDYEAIGNFGVGVFSYFLMSDYIDIETKTKSSETLHFRLDRDPKNYFHFFKEFERTETGTTIILYLNDEMKQIENSVFSKYIKDKFRYMELPLEMKIDGNVEFIEKQSYRFENILDLVGEGLKFEHKKSLNNLKITEIDIVHLDYEGIATVIHNDDYSAISMEMFSDDFDLTTRHRNFSQQVSQKGVFISNISNNIDRLPNFLLKINLLKKFDLQISRNGFSRSEEVGKIIKEIGAEIYKDIYTKKISKTIKKKISENCFHLIHNLQLDSKIIKSIGEYVFLNCRFNNKNLLLSLNQINLEYNKVFLAINKTEISEFEKYFTDVLIVILPESDKHFYFRLYELPKVFKQYDYNCLIINEESNVFTIFDKELKIDSIYSHPLIEFASFENFNKINFNLLNYYNKKYDIGEYLYYKTYLNQNHPFIKNLFLVREELYAKNKKTLFNEILEFMMPYDPSQIAKIKTINILISEANKYVNLKFKLKLKDFDL